MERALLHQSEQCGILGSAMYQRLFADLAADYRDGGRTFAVLAGRSERPIHDAIPLRLAGAIHRVVLEGRDDRLARHYPSVGGKPGPDFTPDFIGYLRDHLDEVEMGLSNQVQTNEVGRSVVHLAMSHWLTTLGIDEFDHLEIGASAGLNLNFDKFYACHGRLRMGDPSSAIRFMGDWFAAAPNIPPTAARVVHRRGVDIDPIDVTKPDQEVRLLSFVWPDQRVRLQRTRAAIEIARQYRPIIDSESAETWLENQLSRPRDRAVVVFHSIVWQYLGAERQRSIREILRRAGEESTPQTPLVWVRMEPAGPMANVQADMWDGSDGAPTHFDLADVGYHGQQMTWH